MHCSLLRRAIFLQALFQDAFQSQMQNVSLLRNMLWAIAALKRQKDYLHMQRWISKFTKQKAEGKTAREMVPLTATGCDRADRGMPAAVLMGQTHRQTLRKADTSEGDILSRAGGGRHRAAKSGWLLLCLFYPHLCPRAALKPAEFCSAEAIEKSHKALRDDSVLH